MIDQVWLKILHSQLVNICEEMGLALMRTSYSPIFSEGLDFYALILDRTGDLVATAKINGAMLGAVAVLGALGDRRHRRRQLRAGRRRDPQRPLPRRLAHAGAPADHAVLLRGRAAGLRRHHRARGRDRRHGARLVRVERHRDLPGGAAPAAGQDRQRRRAGQGRLAHHPRQPPDARDVLGRLARADRRAAASGRAGSRRSTTSTAPAASTRRSRPCSTTPRPGCGGRSRACPTARTRPRTARRTTDSRERPYWIRVDVTVDGDHLIVDYSRSDEQALGAINAPYVVTASGDVQRGAFT